MIAVEKWKPEDNFRDYNIKQAVSHANSGMAACLGKLNMASSGAEANLFILKEHSPSEYFMWQKRLRTTVRGLIERHGY